MIENDFTLAIASIAMPENTNANGDIFGGWLMSQMDLAGSVVARSIAHNRVVTVAANHLQFNFPIKIGEHVQSYGKVTKIGTSSVTIEVIMTSSTLNSNKTRKVASGQFIYVSIDQIGNPQPVKKSNPDCYKS